MRLAVALLCAVALALLVGPAGVTAEAVLLRAPRVAAALIAGAGLAIAGVGMQALLRNALAEPFVLGMSSGASLGAVLAALLWPGLPPALAATAGALSAATLVGAVGRTEDGLLPPTRLLLSGCAVAAVLGALTGFALAVAPQASALRAAIYWTSGSLGAATPPALVVAAAVTLISAAALGRAAGDLDRLLLGEETAASLGVDVGRLRLLLLTLCAGLTGALVALGGPIGFVGLAAPHLARLWRGAT
ncbi:iron ABC transporter permease, partial [Myxococcota bacterium]|nr:iron ABC transporter permease [Myxococcota bacterium]